MLPEECQIHEPVPLFCSTSYTCVFVEPYKKEMKKGGWRGRDRLLCCCLALSLLDFIRGGEDAAVSKQLDSLGGAAIHYSASQMLIIIQQLSVQRRGKIEFTCITTVAFKSLSMKNA